MTTPNRPRLLTALFLGALVITVLALPDEVRTAALVVETVLFFAGAALHYREQRDHLQTFAFWGPEVFEENEELKADNMALTAELEDAQGRLADAEARFDQHAAEALNVVRVPFLRFDSPSTRPNVVALPPRVPKQREGGDAS